MDAHMCIGYRVDFVSVSIRLIKSDFVKWVNGQVIIHIMILKACIAVNLWRRNCQKSHAYNNLMNLQNNETFIP